MLRGARLVVLVAASLAGSLALGLLPDEVTVIDGDAPTDDDAGEDNLNDAVNERGGVQATLVHAGADTGATAGEEDVHEEQHETHGGIDLHGRLVEVHTF